MLQDCLLNFLSKLLEFTHSTCVNFAPIGPYSSYYSGIVCGTQLPAGPALQLWKDVGLIHVLVVSGSHLLLLEAMLARVLPSRLAHKIIPACLIFFSLMTGWQPPAVRSLALWALKRASERCRLAWRSHQLLLPALVITALISKGPCLSISLLLSSLAGLAQCWRIKNDLAGLKRQTLTYLFLLPVLICFGQCDPLLIAINLFYLPVIGGLLFPLSLLAFAIPTFSTISDGCWALCEASLRPWQALIAHLPPAPQNLNWRLWLYALALHLAFHYLESRHLSLDQPDLQMAPA